MNEAIDTALNHARDLLKALDKVFEDRNAGLPVSARQLDQLEDLIEKCAIHEALADNL